MTLEPSDEQVATIEKAIERHWADRNTIRIEETPAIVELVWPLVRDIVLSEVEWQLDHLESWQEVAACHAFFDADGNQWWVSVDRNGIAWTWCTG